MCSFCKYALGKEPQFLFVCQLQQALIVKYFFIWYKLSVSDVLFLRLLIFKSGGEEKTDSKINWFYLNWLLFLFLFLRWEKSEIITSLPNNRKLQQGQEKKIKQKQIKREQKKTKFKTKTTSKIKKQKILDVFCL